METKKLGMLLATVQAGSLKKAAEKLNYSQTGLIYMMNSLEQELEINLLSRNSKGVSLTADGQKLLPYIEEIVNAENKFTEELERLGRHNKNKLWIGAYPIIACYCLPPIIRQFVKENPGIEVSIHVGTREDLTQWLQDGVIDVGIGTRPPDTKNIKWDYLMDDYIYAAFPESYPIDPEQETIRLEELKDYPLLSSTYNPAQSEVERLAADNPNKIVISSKDGSALLCMVEEGLGATFLSGFYLNECPSTVRMLPLDPPVVRPIGISSRINSAVPLPVRKFRTYLRSVDWEEFRK